MRPVSDTSDEAAGDARVEEMEEGVIKEPAKFTVGVCKGTHLAPLVFRMFERLAHLPS